MWNIDCVSNFSNIYRAHPYLWTSDLQVCRWAELLIPLQPGGGDQLWNMVVFTSGRQNLLFLQGQCFGSVSFHDNVLKSSFAPDCIQQKECSLSLPLLPVYTLLLQASSWWVLAPPPPPVSASWDTVIYHWNHSIRDILDTQQKFCGMLHVYGLMFSFYMDHSYRILIKDSGGLMCTWGNWGMERLGNLPQGHCTQWQSQTFSPDSVTLESVLTLPGFAQDNCESVPEG